MYYCSPEHQKKHWRKHKFLCNHLAAAAEAAAQESFFSSSSISSQTDWNLFRSNAVRTAAVILGRELDLQEQEVLLFPRSCRSPACHVTSGEMQDCLACHAVTYCSVQHREEGADQHKTVCRQLRLCRLLDQHEALVGVGLPAIPSHLDSSYLASAPDISHFLDQPWQGKISDSVTREEVQWAFLTNQLSGPLTLLDIGNRFLSDMGTRKILTVHVVGAGVVEMMGVIKWEYLAHRLPNLHGLTFVFVGPELEAESEDEPVVPVCGDCVKLGRTVEYRVYCGTYTNYLHTDTFTKPDLVMAQNCGFSEFQASPDCEGWTEGWAGLDSLLQGNCPVVFTSYTLGEARQDLARLLDTVQGEVEVLARCESNPMRSHRPIRDWERDQDRDMFYSNQFLSVVQRRITDTPAQ